MKKSMSMITLILALAGCLLTAVSVFFLFKGSFASDEEVTNAKTELEIANKKITDLSSEIEEKVSSFAEIQDTLNSKIISVQDTLIKNVSIAEPIGIMASKNIPIVEITNSDINEDDNQNPENKKIHRLMYHHQLKFSLMNGGRNSLKDVIFSVKDVYNDPNFKKSKKRENQYQYMGQIVDNKDIGAYENIDLKTLNLKSKKMIYTSNLPSSYGMGDYYYDIIVEWSEGFYQMHVDVIEKDGKLSFKYKFYDVDGNEINNRNPGRLVSN